MERVDVAIAVEGRSVLDAGMLSDVVASGFSVDNIFVMFGMIRAHGPQSGVEALRRIDGVGEVKVDRDAVRPRLRSRVRDTAR